MTVANAAGTATAGSLKLDQRPRGLRRSMIGKVVKNKMMKTVVVECVTARKDSLYGKYVRTRSRYKAHDEDCKCRVGDEVEIQEHRPLSREKRFTVVRLVKKFVEE